MNMMIVNNNNNKLINIKLIHLIINHCRGTPTVAHVGRSPLQKQFKIGFILHYVHLLLGIVFIKLFKEF